MPLILPLYHVHNCVFQSNDVVTTSTVNDSSFIYTLSCSPFNVYFLLFLGIMVNGQFQCLGSIQHLKNRFGSGYSLTVRCSDIELVQRHMERMLPRAQVKEEHVTQIKYQLPIQSTKLPVVFRCEKSTL